MARTYRGNERNRISLPVGGIGTGTIGFGGRGQFRDWELENHPSKGADSPLTFLACRILPKAGKPEARILEGTLFDEEVEGQVGTPSPMGGLPRFSSCEFESTYPFGRVLLADPHFPVRARVEVFNPLCPGDPELSGLPIAVVRVVLESVADEPLDASIMLSIESHVGHSLRLSDQPSRPTAAKRSGQGYEGYVLGDEAIDPGDEASGTLAAAVLGDGTWSGPTWGVGKWNQGFLAMWRELVDTGRPGSGLWGMGSTIATSSARVSAIAGTLGADRVLAPGATAELTFLIGWHFPNRKSWIWTKPGPAGAAGEDTVGNFYSLGATDAWGVIAANAPRVPELAEVTQRFVSSFWSSDLAPAVKEAALFNVSTLRSQTFFRAADGFPFGWEGCMDDAGSCLGSCTHVWNYDLATAFLFPGIARQMRELEYAYAVADDGAMSFRILLPLTKSKDYPLAAADGQFGCVVKLFREWRMSGDDEWLARLWPHCRRSIEFAWIEGGWDADRDGMAEGAQHNTMDVEYFGPNPVIQGWYLAALKAATEMAGAVGDKEFADTCREIFESGLAATERELYNGTYYIQHVVPPADFSKVAPKLRSREMGAEQADTPEFQIEDGCLIDQLVGDTYAKLAGIGPVLDADHVRTTLATIHRLNYVEDFGDWTNCMRTYAVQGERGHIVLSYPNGVPVHPMPYWSEVWTGLEYVYAIGLAQIGDTALAEDVVAAARERFSGTRRNPFDEAECGHHYARAMASWGVVVAMTGFSYDGRSNVMSFAGATTPTTWYWSTAGGWGTVTQSTGDDGRRVVQLEVLHGGVRIDRVLVGGEGFAPKSPGLLAAGAVYELDAQS